MKYGSKRINHTAPKRCCLLLLSSSLHILPQEHNTRLNLTNFQTSCRRRRRRRRRANSFSHPQKKTGILWKKHQPGDQTRLLRNPPHPAASSSQQSWNPATNWSMERSRAGVASCTSAHSADPVVQQRQKTQRTNSKGTNSERSRMFYRPGKGDIRRFRSSKTTIDNARKKEPETRQKQSHPSGRDKTIIDGHHHPGVQIPAIWKVHK